MRVESGEIPQEGESRFVCCLSPAERRDVAGPRRVTAATRIRPRPQVPLSTDSDAEDQGTMAISVDQRSEGHRGMLWAERDYPPAAWNISHHSGAGAPQGGWGGISCHPATFSFIKDLIFLTPSAEEQTADPPSELGRRTPRKSQLTDKGAGNPQKPCALQGCSLQQPERPPFRLLSRGGSARIQNLGSQRLWGRS